MEQKQRLTTLLSQNGTLTIPESFPIVEDTTLFIGLGCGINAGTLVCTYLPRIEPEISMGDYREVKLFNRTFELSDRELIYIGCSPAERELELSRQSRKYFTIQKSPFSETKLFK